MEKQLSEKLPRIEVVDALRGFAVMAILLVHNLEHFIFPVYPTGDPGWLNILNDGVFNITFSLFAGKAYAIFALLFGFTFYIQSANQQRKGKGYGYTLPDLGVGPMYQEVAAYTKEGNFGEFIWGNITLGQKASLYWALGAGRFWQTAGLFLMGLYIGRKQLFVSSEANTRFWVKALIISAIAFAPLFQLKELVMASGSPLVQGTVGTAFDMWQKFAFTVVLVASFVLLYQKEGFKKFVSNLRFYGKMSLSNYIGQSIAGAIIYFPFGLYLAPYCGYTLSLIIGFVLFFLQVYFCKWWLKSHKQGPLEGIWHKWTWLGANK